MQLTVTFRHMHPSDAIKEHIEDKLEKFKKYLIKPIEAHVILSVEKFRQQCEVTLMASNFRATALQTDHNLYAAIDMAMHKLERQTKKHKEIIRRHKKHASLREVVAIV